MVKFGMLPVYLSAVIILSATILYGVVHSMLAASRVKALAHRYLGEIAGRSYRLFFNIFAVISLLPVLALVAILPDSHIYSIPIPYVYITAGVQGLAVLVLMVGLLQTGAGSFFGLRQLFVGEEKGKSGMVVRGLYCWVRHPLYTAGLIFIWLAPVMTLNTLALNIGLSLYLFIGAIVEERKLIYQFGEDYIRYRQKTPMIIPIPLKRCSFGIKEYNIL